MRGQSWRTTGVELLLLRGPGIKTVGEAAERKCQLSVASVRVPFDAALVARSVCEHEDGPIRAVRPPALKLY